MKRSVSWRPHGAAELHDAARPRSAYTLTRAAPVTTSTVRRVDAGIDAVTRLCVQSTIMLTETTGGAGQSTVNVPPAAVGTDQPRVVRNSQAPVTTAPSGAMATAVAHRRRELAPKSLTRTRPPIR